MDIDRVLDEYRQGDADKRMSLFLYHRELRDAFSGIEQDKPADLSVFSGISKPKQQSIFSKVF
jgi:hypothetical protein